MISNRKSSVQRTRQRSTKQTHDDPNNNGSEEVEHEPHPKLPQSTKPAKTKLGLKHKDDDPRATEDPSPVTQKGAESGNENEHEDPQIKEQIHVGNVKSANMKTHIHGGDHEESQNVGHMGQNMGSKKGGASSGELSLIADNIENGSQFLDPALRSRLLNYASKIKSRGKNKQSEEANVDGSEEVLMKGMEEEKKRVKISLWKKVSTRQIAIDLEEGKTSNDFEKGCLDVVKNNVVLQLLRKYKSNTDTSKVKVKILAAEGELSLVSVGPFLTIVSKGLHPDKISDSIAEQLKTSDSKDGQLSLADLQTQDGTQLRQLWGITEDSAYGDAKIHRSALEVFDNFQLMVATISYDNKLQQSL